MGKLLGQTRLHKACTHICICVVHKTTKPFLSKRQEIVEQQSNSSLVFTWLCCADNAWVSSTGMSVFVSCPAGCCAQTEAPGQSTSGSTDEVCVAASTSIHSHAEKQSQQNLNAVRWRARGHPADFQEHHRQRSSSVANLWQQAGKALQARTTFSQEMQQLTQADML